jgi:hypothetical protein
MTELSFLIDLLMEHKLPRVTKLAIAERIKLVESIRQSSSPAPRPTSPAVAQAPSTMALLAKHGALPPTMPIDAPPPEEPVTVVAQTPETAAAMISRQTAIAESIAGKVDKVTGRPRKW